MKGLSLYELNSRAMEIVVEIEIATAEENEELIAQLEATLAELSPAIDKKRESYVHVIRSADAHAKALRDEAKRLTDRARQMENLAKRLTHALHQDMVNNGEVKAKAGLFQLRIANNPYRVKLSIPVEALPEEYREVSYHANTQMLRDALKNGIEVDGAELTRGTHLQIR